MGRCLVHITGLFVLLGQIGQAGEPLHVRIDRQVGIDEPDCVKKSSPRADDAEFLRRVTLDLTGTLPTSSEARTFLMDSSPDKRVKWIDRLLSSPEHARRMQEHFSVLLMERRPDKYVPQAAWIEYLRSAFASNQPWDLLVREILLADGKNPKTRPAAKFYLDREGEPNQITRDVSRLLLGMNLNCAQCHDHPHVQQFKQEYYFGIFSFLNRTSLFTDKAKVVMLAEKADGQVTFQSVFDPKKETKKSVPSVPFGMAIQDPPVEKGKEYEVAPADGVRPVPKFSRRSLLADQVTGKNNLQFRRNIANRLWAMMLGRGLVHPLDMDHPDNPPSHPGVLTLLTEEMASSKYDIREILREIALSNTYQRSSAMPVGIKVFPPTSLAVARLKPLSPEQLAWSSMQASGLTDAEVKAAGKTATPQAITAKLQGNLTHFTAMYGGKAGQPDPAFEANLDQTLFLSNGSLIRSWLAPRNGNLVDRLVQIKEPNGIAEELYLSVLTRYPEESERREIAEFLKTRPENPSGALQELVWALMASTEFRFNH